jgi:hypothetical protein
MRFSVLADGSPRSVELDFGSQKDLRMVSHWRAPAGVKNTSAVRDALEFAHLAATRHGHYSALPTAHTAAQLKSMLSRQADLEIALMFVVRADWFKRSSILGIAHCRRTYCHHLVLEFLSVHPSIVGRLSPRILGVGKGLVYGLAEIANEIGVKKIWGEATANSAAFYSHILFGARVADRFLIEKRALARCRRDFREKFLGELD